MPPFDPQKQRLQIPLMFAFRDAFEQKDATDDQERWVEGERLIADRNLVRRSAAENLLKRDLGIDLGSLVDTINLASTTDLSGLPHVAKSVLNFGLPDLSNVTVEASELEAVGASLKAAMLRHEPRLNPETLTVTRSGDDADARQRVSFRVSAEMLSRPLDIPVEFVAEVDIGAGKVLVSRLPGMT